MPSRLLPTAADGPDCGLLMPKVIVSLVTPLVVPLHRAGSTVPSARVAGALESAESPRPHADVVVNARARMATTGSAPRRNCIEGFLSTVMGCVRVRDLGFVAAGDWEGGCWTYVTPAPDATRPGSGSGSGAAPGDP